MPRCTVVVHICQIYAWKLLINAWELYWTSYKWTTSSLMYTGTYISIWIFFHFSRFYSHERIWHHHLTWYYTHSRLHYWLWFVVAVKMACHLNISYYIATIHHYMQRFVVSSATANVCWHWTVDMPIAPYFIFWRCEALRGQLQIMPHD